MFEVLDTEQSAIIKVHSWLVDNLVPDTLLFVGGGSLAKIFANAWKQLDAEQKAMAIITLTDERYGKPGHKDSNWQLLINLGVDLENPRCLPVLQSGIGLQESATVWAEELAKAIKKSNNVMAIFGIGTDNHIAGIKPRSPASKEKVNITTAYAWQDYERITLSPTFFKLIDNALIYTCGKPKKQPVESLKQNLNPVEYPSQLIKQSKQYKVYYLA
jgi:6-phosphogluconolactonase/glucosamine-6-phosphate isomerase/deaminase